MSVTAFCQVLPARLQLVNNPRLTPHPYFLIRAGGVNYSTILLSPRDSNNFVNQAIYNREITSGDEDETKIDTRRIQGTSKVPSVTSLFQKALSEVTNLRTPSRINATPARSIRGGKTFLKAQSIAR